MKSISPLRYPGGKTRAINKLRKFLPNDVKLLCSPFLGGGSFELFCVLNYGIKVLAYDLFEPLVVFWNCLLEDQERLAAMVSRYLPVVTKEQFYKLQNSFKRIHDPWELATALYVINRTSFSGLTVSGGFSSLNEKGRNGRFNENNVDFLRTFQIPEGMLCVEHLSFEESLQRNPHHFAYIDPPYLVESKLYGNQGDLHDIDHNLLADILHTRNNWILSYNDCNQVRQLYRGFSLVDRQEGLSWSYGMNSSRKSKEILILSNDVAEQVGHTNLSKRTSRVSLFSSSMGNYPEKGITLSSLPSVAENFRVNAFCLSDRFRPPVFSSLFASASNLDRDSRILVGNNRSRVQLKLLPLPG